LLALDGLERSLATGYGSVSTIAIVAAAWTAVTAPGRVFCILVKLRAAAARKAGLEALIEDWAAIEAILGAKTREAIAMMEGFEMETENSSIQGDDGRMRRKVRLLLADGKTKGSLGKRSREETRKKLA